MAPAPAVSPAYPPGKLAFTPSSPAYLPSRFKAEPLQARDGEATQYFLTGDYDMGYFRQALLTAKGSDWVCDMGPCTIVGQDATGRTVYRYSSGSGRTFWGVKLAQTHFVIVGQARAHITDAEAVQILGSLQEVKN